MREEKTLTCLNIHQGVGGRSGFCYSKMNFLTVSENESIHAFIYPSASLYEASAECKGSARWWICKQKPATVLGPQEFMAMWRDSSSIRCNAMWWLLSRSMTVGLERCRLCLGEKGKHAKPAAGRGEGAFRQRGHHGQRQKSHKGPVGEGKRQSAGQQPNGQNV